MNIVKSILTKNPCYTSGRKITVAGLMLHSVGCPQPNASVFITNWNKSDFNGACVHGFIDGNTGDVYQTLPWDHRGWHCGSGSNGSGNNTHIGIEMCEPACIKYTNGSEFTCSNTDEAKAVVTRTYNSAVELFATLCKQYNLDPTKDGVIVSHNEGHKRGIASNHGDPEHLWKGLGTGYTMDKFRKDVKVKMTNDKTIEDSTSPNEKLYRVRKTWKDTSTQKGAFTELDNAKKCADNNPGYSVYDDDGTVVYEGNTTKNENSTKQEFVPYKVEVDIERLRIRSGPGTNYSPKGKCTGRGIFTIVDEATDSENSKWGLLKSYKDARDGWISLNYAKKI